MSTSKPSSYDAKPPSKDLLHEGRHRRDQELHDHLRGSQVVRSRSQVQADASRRLGLRWMRGKTHVRGVYNAAPGQSAGEREREDF